MNDAFKEEDSLSAVDKRNVLRVERASINMSLHLDNNDTAYPGKLTIPPGIDQRPSSQLADPTLT